MTLSFKLKELNLIKTLVTATVRPRWPHLPSSPRRLTSSWDSSLHCLVASSRCRGRSQQTHTQSWYLNLSGLCFDTATSWNRQSGFQINRQNISQFTNRCVWKHLDTQQYNENSFTSKILLCLPSLSQHCSSWQHNTHYQGWREED